MVPGPFTALKRVELVVLVELVDSIMYGSEAHHSQLAGWKLVVLVELVAFIMYGSDYHSFLASWRVG
jgi:hypothetical protein